MFDNVDFSKVDLSDAKLAKSLEAVDVSLKDVISDHAAWVKITAKKAGVRSLPKWT